MNDRSSSDGTLRRVLVVNDEPHARDLVAGYLTEAGFHVDTAANSEEALSVARMARPSLITLDIFLRNESGFGTLYDLRRFPETACIPLLVLSTAKQRDMGMTLGASDCLLKPVQKRELLAIAQKLTS